MNSEEVLDTAIKRLNTWGWRKGGLGHPHQWVCLKGALILEGGTTNPHDYLETQQAMALVRSCALEMFPQRVKDCPNDKDPAVLFNDDPRTTFDDVIAVLEKARAKAGEL